MGMSLLGRPARDFVAANHVNEKRAYITSDWLGLYCFADCMCMSFSGGNRAPI